MWALFFDASIEATVSVATKVPENDLSPIFTKHNEPVEVSYEVWKWK